VHQPGESHDRRRNTAGDSVIGEVDDREPLEIPDIFRNLARNLVSDQVEDSERGQRCDALGYLAGDSLPVGDDELGEPVELADLGRDRPGHVPAPTRFLEHRVLRLAPEVNVRDSATCRVAAHAVPAGATVSARPRVEDAQVRFGQRGLEGQQSCPV